MCASQGQSRPSPSSYTHARRTPTRACVRTHAHACARPHTRLHACTLVPSHPPVPPCLPVPPCPPVPPHPPTHVHAYPHMRAYTRYYTRTRTGVCVTSLRPPLLSSFPPPHPFSPRLPWCSGARASGGSTRAAVLAGGGARTGGTSRPAAAVVAAAASSFSRGGAGPLPVLPSSRPPILLPPAGVYWPACPRVHVRVHGCACGCWVIAGDAPATRLAFAQQSESNPLFATYQPRARGCTSKRVRRSPVSRLLPGAGGYRVGPTPPRERGRRVKTRYGQAGYHGIRLPGSCSRITRPR